MIFSGKRYVQCNKCDVKKKVPNLLREHINAEHLKMRFPCTLCPFSCKYIQGLRVHHRIVHEGTRYKCSFCQFSTRSLLCFNKHSIKKHQVTNPAALQIQEGLADKRKPISSLPKSYFRPKNFYPFNRSEFSKRKFQRQVATV